MDAKKSFSVELHLTRREAEMLRQIHKLSAMEKFLQDNLSSPGEFESLSVDLWEALNKVLDEPDSNF